MKSVNEIKKIAKKLAYYAKDSDGKIDVHAASKISHMIRDEKLPSINIHVENIQRLLLLKEYEKLIQNLVIEDSVIVTSAITLDERQKERIEHAFKAGLLHFGVSDDVIGGLKIQSGWDIIDDTIQNTLHILPF